MGGFEPFHSQDSIVNSPPLSATHLLLIGYVKLVFDQDKYFYMIIISLSLLVWIMYGDQKEKVHVHHF